MDEFVLMKVCACIVIVLPCALFGRPKNVQGCPAAPEEFSPTAFLALFLFHGSQRMCEGGGGGGAHERESASE